VSPGPVWRQVKTKTWFTADVDCNATQVEFWRHRVAPDDTVWLIGAPLPAGADRLTGRIRVLTSPPRPVHLPLLGGPLLGGLVVVAHPDPTAARRVAKAGGLSPWLLCAAGEDWIDPALRAVNISMRAWGNAPVAADELAALIEDFEPGEAARQLASMEAAARARGEATKRK
jgi:hypothetical protein